MGGRGDVGTVAPRHAVLGPASGGENAEQRSRKRTREKLEQEEKAATRAKARTAAAKAEAEAQDEAKGLVAGHEAVVEGTTWDCPLSVELPSHLTPPPPPRGPGGLLGLAGGRRRRPETGPAQRQLRPI